MTDGLSRLTTVASTSPMSRPARRTAAVACGSLRSSSSRTSRVPMSSRGRSGKSSAAMARPLATASRQPVLPHSHRTSGACGARTWPRSPAEPTAPRCSRRPLMRPAPMPVATLTKTKWSTPGYAARVLAEGHQVDVVVDVDRGAEALLDPRGDGEAVPARHDRRLDRHPGGVLDRAGQADPDAGELGGGGAGLGHELARGRDQPAQRRLGAVGDVQLAGWSRRSPRRPGR